MGPYAHRGGRFPHGPSDNPMLLLSTRFSTEEERVSGKNFEQLKIPEFVYGHISFEARIG